MLSIQQLIKALRKLQNSSVVATTVAAGSGGDLMKQNLKHVVATAATSTANSATGAELGTAAAVPAMMTSLLSVSSVSISPKQQEQQQQQYEQQQQLLSANDSSQQSEPCEVNCQTSQERGVSFVSFVNESGGVEATQSESGLKLTQVTRKTNATNVQASHIQHQNRSQQIQNFYQQHLHHFHTQHNQSLYAKQKPTQYSEMSSLAAEPCTLKQPQQQDHNMPTMNGQHADSSGDDQQADTNGASCNDEQNSSSDKPCFSAGFGQILQFMELIGNLKHTKRTGWVLRDVNDCESISGHMYRMSMMTFLLDGSEGLNQIRCMELALVHDLAESLVGDITPFCGVSKSEKRAMEFKAMDDICKLIEPRGKRIMELFEEYEQGESAESKFVKDLDRLDMVMQAFEYEKRDNCLLKHQEFFDSTEGKFKHPFVKKLVDEIYEQRRELARVKGASPPPPVHVPDMEETNGQNKDSGRRAASATSDSKSNASSS